MSGDGRRQPPAVDPWGEDYGDVPEMLAGAESASVEEADTAWERIFQRLFGVNGRYPSLDRLAPVIAAAVPHFVALARSAPHGRATALSAAGRAADSERSFRPSSEERGALQALAPRMVPLLDDPDAAVRASAVYALSQAGVDAGPLRHRLAVEAEPDVRAALLLALGAEAVGTLELEGTVAVAAALVSVRAGLPLPPNTAAAVLSGAEAPADWRRRELTLADLLCATDGALLDALPSTVPVLRAVEDCCRWHRLARAWAAQWAGRLLLDDDPSLRAAAVDAVAATGAAAAPWADDLARAATLADTPADAREKAIWVLGRLGDPRWVQFGGWTACGWPVLSATQVDAVGALLGRASAAGNAEVVVTLADQLQRLGARASALAPQLRAARALAPREVAWALARMDAAEPADLPALRSLPSEGFAELAFACRRLTGDRSVVVEAIRQAIDASELPQVALGLTMAVDAGLKLPGLLETLRKWQRPGDAPPRVHRAQLAAARVLVAAGEPVDKILATVRSIAGQGGLSAGLSASLAADLGWTELIDDLLVALDSTTDPAPVAEALWRLGVPADDLTPRLLAAVEDGLRSAEAVQALVTIAATKAAPRLDRLAERDRSVVYDHRPHIMVWCDDHLRSDLRAAAATLGDRCGP
ncbi:hypothetical protein [Dactylosporangium sp. CA-233914]|uniref:hypothetical protein n=1 Tax=Dactylosporangium sp. CA-233914 TaxID=3239934 RepID=UPI003D8B82C4